MTTGPYGAIVKWRPLGHPCTPKSKPNTTQGYGQGTTHNGNVFVSHANNLELLFYFNNYGLVPLRSP
jgi:hypothetical protein